MSLDHVIKFGNIYSGDPTKGSWNPKMKKKTYQFRGSPDNGECLTLQQGICSRLGFPQALLVIVAADSC
jgi:hypothetical protein